MKKTALKGFLTIGGAAKLLRVAPLTLRNWDKSGRFKAYRHPVNRYRLYKKEDLEKFKARGLKRKVEEIKGYENSIRLRVKDFKEAQKSIDNCVGPGSTTKKDPKVDQLVQKEIKKAIKRGVKIRFIRDLNDEVMWERALAEKKIGAKVRHFPIKGVNISIRDQRVVRLEVPLEGRSKRLNIIIHDKNVAGFFAAFFEAVWEKAELLEGFVGGSTMNKNLLKTKIDAMVEEILENLKSRLGKNIESIALTGSYVIEKMSLERPNVNILVFLKPYPPAEVYLKAGKLLYEIGEKYRKFFSLRVSMFPFRFARPMGEKEPEVSVNLNFYDMADKNLCMWVGPNKRIKTPFGAPEQVVQGMKSMRKIVFGTDVLGSMEFEPTYEDILWGIMKEMPVYKLQLTRAPMTYDIDKDYALLAAEAVEVGKACLGYLVAALLGAKAVKEGRHIELFAEKDKILEFLKKTEVPSVSEWAEIVLNARKNFLKIKKDKRKAFEVYDAAYNILNMTFKIAADKLFSKRGD